MNGTQKIRRRKMTREQKIFFDEAINVLSPATPDFYSLEKVATMVGNEITEAVFYRGLAAVRSCNADKPTSYFFGVLKKLVPDFYVEFNQIFVVPGVSE